MQAEAAEIEYMNKGNNYVTAWSLFTELLSRSAESHSPVITNPGDGQYECQTLARGEGEYLRPYLDQSKRYGHFG